MKIRNGFVSNSSSSSFMIVATSEAMDRALQFFSPIERKFIGLVLPRADIATLGKQKYETYLETLYDDTLYECWNETIEDQSEEYQDYDFDNIWDSFINKLKNEKNAFVKET